jgi:excisionase family DNA binding protein
MKSEDHHKEAIKTETSPIPRIALSMQELADSFGVSRSTVYEWVDGKLLKTFTIGRRRFVSMEEAKALATRLTNQ